MGYGAFVPCTCHQEGRTTPPPVPVRWNAEDGQWEADPEDDETWWAAYHWTQTACEHPHMQRLSAYLTNVSGMAYLRGAAEELGLVHLRAALPVLNGGHVTAAQAALILPELNVLEGTPILQTFVRDGQRVIWSHQGDEDTTFHWFENLKVGAGARGVFVWEDGRELFRSRFFRQVVHGGHATFTALDGPAHTSLGLPLGLEDGKAPEVLHVSCEVAPSEALTCMAGTLRTLMTEAARTGQPVYWT